MMTGTSCISELAFVDGAVNAVRIVIAKRDSVKVTESSLEGE